MSSSFLTLKTYTSCVVGTPVSPIVTLEMTLQLLGDVVIFESSGSSVHSLTAVSMSLQAGSKSSPQDVLRKLSGFSK